MYTEHDIEQILGVSQLLPSYVVDGDSPPIVGSRLGYLNNVRGAFQVQAIDRYDPHLADGGIICGRTSAVSWRVIPHSNKRNQSFSWSGAMGFTRTRPVSDVLRAMGGFPRDTLPIVALPDCVTRDHLSLLYQCFRTTISMFTGRRDTDKLLDSIISESGGLVGAANYIIQHFGAGEFFYGVFTNQLGFSVTNVPESMLSIMWPDGVEVHYNLVGWKVPVWFYEISRDVIAAGGPLLVPVWVSRRAYVLNQDWSDPCVGNGVRGTFDAVCDRQPYWTKLLGGVVSYAAVEAYGSPSEWTKPLPKEWKDKLRSVADGLISAVPQNWAKEVVCFSLRHVPTLLLKDGRLQAIRLKVSADKFGQMNAVKALPCEFDGTIKPPDPNLDFLGRTPEDLKSDPHHEPEDDPDDEADYVECHCCHTEYDAREQGTTCGLCGNETCDDCYRYCSGCGQPECTDCRDDPDERWVCEHCGDWRCSDHEPFTSPEPQGRGLGVVLSLCSRRCAEAWVSNVMRFELAQWNAERPQPTRPAPVS